MALKDIDLYGDANAENIKTAIDDTFIENLNITEEQHTKIFVCAISDGANVYTLVSTMD